MHKIYDTPFAQFSAWYDHAGRKTLWRRILTWLYPPAVIHQPDAMILSTADHNGKPSSRVVLFKGIEDDGLVFFTNYTSQKGRELAVNSKAAIVFHWAFPERQVRIEGIAKKITREKSVAYWRTRPRGSQLSGAASNQSAVIASRDALVKTVKNLKQKIGAAEIPCPEVWGGFCVKPSRLEFWEGRANRLHERVLFTRENASWKRELLEP